MLTYDDARHEYRLNGRPIPSVTQALKLAGHIDDWWYTPEAAARGTAVHTACELVDGGPARRTASAMHTDDDIAGYVDAYQMFSFDTQVVYSEIEVMCAHPDGTYAGRPDRIVANLLGEAGVLEIKTSRTPEDWHSIQLAAYQLLRPVGSRWVVYLSTTGRYKLVRCTHADDYRRWRNALALAWMEIDASKR